MCDEPANKKRRKAWLATSKAAAAAANPLLTKQSFTIGNDTKVHACIPKAKAKTAISQHEFYLLPDTTFYINLTGSGSNFIEYLPKISTSGFDADGAGGAGDPSFSLDFLVTMQRDYSVLLDIAVSIGSSAASNEHKVKYLIETRRFARKYFFGKGLNLGDSSPIVAGGSGFLQVIDVALQSIKEKMLLFIKQASLIKNESKKQALLGHIQTGNEVLHNFLDMLNNIQLLEIDLPYITSGNNHWTLEIIKMVQDDISCIEDLSQQAQAPAKASATAAATATATAAAQIATNRTTAAAEASGGGLKRKSLKNKKRRRKKSKKKYSRKLRLKSTRSR
jgi:hypothetical protein